jgi:hypothetical protein
MRSFARVDWNVVEGENGPSFRWGYLGDEIVAEWSGLLSLRATRTGRVKAVQPAPGAPRELVEKALRGVAAAFLRARSNQHALHASAVAYRMRALVCVGASGMGKSTMAECMCRRSGAEVLADDVAYLDVLPAGGVQVAPSESAVWLETRGSSEKMAVKITSAAERATPLGCIVALAFDASAQKPEISELRGGDAVSALLPALIRFEKTTDLWERELDFVAHLIANGRVYRAVRPDHCTPDVMANALLALANEVP